MSKGARANPVKRTPIGRVDWDNTNQGFGTRVMASARELEQWANRPGARWPASTLRRARRVWALFDSRGNLVDIDHPGVSDVDAHELNAWSSDVLRAAGLGSHPAIRNPRGSRKSVRRNPDTGDILRSFHDARRAERGEARGGVLEEIRPGDRVRIQDRFGKVRQGRAVMRGPHGWVLNMGGAHGTPAIADARNIVSVLPAKGKRVKSNPKGTKVQRFLVNPDRASRAKPRRKAMAKRRTPPRYKSGPKKGQFMPRSARRRARRNPGRTVAPQAIANPRRRRRRASVSSRRPRRRRYRRNPPTRRGIPGPRQLMGTLTSGLVEAGQVLFGKAVVRSVPDLAGLPKEGNVGLAVQSAVALVAGVLADMFLSKDASRAILAGGLTAPLETVIVAYRVPWLSGALSPVSSTTQLSAYVMGANGQRLGAYARERIAPRSNERGLGSYVSASSR